MTQPRTHSTWDQLRRRLRDLRERRGLSQQQLSARLEEIGVTLHPTAIAKIEAGTRAVMIDEVMALALVLNVSPVNLLLPRSDDVPVEVAPRATFTALWVRNWFAGMTPLPADTDELAYRAASDEFMREAPEREQREYRAATHPAMRLIDGLLRTFVRDAVLVTQGLPSENQAFDRAVAATGLRDAAERVKAYVDLLADEVERLPAPTKPKGGRRGQR